MLSANRKCRKKRAKKTCTWRKKMGEDMTEEKQKHSLTVKEICEIIPHRHPFLLVDYIEDYKPGE